MSLKRMLNDDDVVYQPTSITTIFSPTISGGTVYHDPYSASLSAASSVPRSAQSTTFPRSPPFTSPTGTLLNLSPSTDGTVDYPDVDPVMSESPNQTMADIFTGVLNGVLDMDSDASRNNAILTSNFDFDGQLEQWAAENMTMDLLSLSSPNTQRQSLSVGGSSPSRLTPTPTTPSMVQDSGASTADTVDDSDAAEKICYGMIHRRDVKLVGQMATLQTKLDRSTAESPQPVQRFTLSEQPEHILLAFKDDGADFGYLRPDLTRALERLLRLPACELEAVVPTAMLRETVGRAKKPSEAMVKVDIYIYGQRSHANKIGNILSDEKLWLQQPIHAHRSYTYDNPHVLSFPGLELDAETLRTVVARDTARRQPRGGDQLQSFVTNVLGQLQRGQNLARFRGGGEIKGHLLEHQEEAQEFMRQRESGEIPERFRLWKPKMVDGEQWFYHAITKNKCRTRPEENGGGILADEMGMGKSLSILTLIVDTLDAGQAWAEKQQESEVANKLVKHSRSTLIVVSSALLINNWDKEISKHLEGSIKVIRYHGPDREKALDVIENSDIVITTYNTLAAEFSEKRSVLHNIGWYRVVLDEAHIIRRQATLFHRSCADLTARSRWCLTGTPIQNKLEDIGALFAFIRANPFNSLATFRRYVQTPFEQSSDRSDPSDDEIKKVQERLVMIFDSLVLRRTKEVLKLPNLISRVRKLRLSASERYQYENTKKILHRVLKQRVGVHEKNSKFGLFQVNLQMRIMCNHGTFQRQFSWQRRSQRDEREAAASAIGNNAEITCSGCNQPMPIVGSSKIYNPFVENCAHALCSECLEESRGADVAQVRHCPICQSHSGSLGQAVQHQHHRERVSSLYRAGSADDVEMPDAAPSASPSAHVEEHDDHYFQQEGYSTKMEALVKDVYEDLWDKKSIIFSCWTRTLNLVARHLDREKIPYLRIDGDCPLVRRQEILDQFSDDPTKPVLIMTTGTGAFGLNLTCANRVFIVELQWNPSVENQAIARAIRFGQEQQVIVTRYIITQSIEEEMQSQQSWKLEMGKLGFQKVMENGTLAD